MSSEFTFNHLVLKVPPSDLIPRSGSAVKKWGFDLHGQSMSIVMYLAFFGSPSLRKLKDDGTRFGQ